MTTAQNILLSTIREKRPLVLLLGEEAWGETPNEDPILVASLKTLGRSGEGGVGWADVLSTEKVHPDYYQWLIERFERRVHPPYINVLRELPWSAIFTSSIDPTLIELFSYRGREIEPILTAEERPRVARSTARPPLYFLFSRAGEEDPKAQTPLDLMGLISRRSQHAVPMLNRIIDTATPLGTIVVDGYFRASGWLRFEDLLGAITSLSSKQVLWFGGLPALSSDDGTFFKALEERGLIVVEERRLGTVIAELNASGRLDNQILIQSEEAGRITFGPQSVYDVPPEVRLKAEAVASIVDDSWTSFLPPLGPDSRYDAFRRFHGALGGPRSLVEGIRRNFAIVRDFEEKLQKQVFAALADHSKLDSPIVVGGQSGTGKSVALARLVSKVREQRSAAVLYSTGRIPQSQEVAEFCQSAERSGARVTLLVCDSNRSIDNYDELLGGLRSLGRRVVIVGSQYRGFNSDSSNQLQSVDAPSDLSEDERGRLFDLLANFDVSVQDQQEDDHFLAFLYRHLPASRPQIGSGLGAEARATVQTLHDRGTKSHTVPIISDLHQQLIEKGYISKYQPIFSDEQTVGLDVNDRSAGKIIDMVMVSGRLNCPVPINLLLRAVSQYQQFNSDLISDLFSDLDLFRWISRDSEGNEWMVVPRLPLEARLICERRLGSPQAEADVLVDLIGWVRLGIDDTNERVFLLDLLQQIGRDGPRGNAYKRSYVEFARKLSELRNRYNVVDARLMLQESSFRRSAVREDQADVNEKYLLLEEARDAVQTALDEIDNGRLQASRQTRQNLLVERAALYGFLANDRAQRNKTSQDIWSAYEAARVAVRQAVSAADDYYPHDVGLWSPADLFVSENITELQRAELAADIYSTLDQVERNSLPPSQRARFHRRRMNVGSILRDHALTDDAYNKLEDLGSTAGYFLRARELAPDLTNHDIEIVSHSGIAKAKKAAKFLTERFELIQQDERCLWLLLENRWITEMRRCPLRGQRKPLPFGDARIDLLKIVRLLNVASGDSARYGTRYLEAVLTWVTGEFAAARDIFRQLYQDTYYIYRGRIELRHVISEPNGSPKRFKGRVESAAGQGRWRLRVSQFNQVINLFERDFRQEDIRYGRNLSGFSIAFNFTGPRADPIRR